MHFYSRFDASAGPHLSLHSSYQPTLTDRVGWLAASDTMARNATEAFSAAISLGHRGFCNSYVFEVRDIAQCNFTGDFHS